MISLGQRGLPHKCWIVSLQLVLVERLVDFDVTKGAQEAAIEKAKAIDIVLEIELKFLTRKRELLQMLLDSFQSGHI